MPIIAHRRVNTGLHLFSSVGLKAATCPSWQRAGAKVLEGSKAGYEREMSALIGGIDKEKVGMMHTQIGIQWRSILRVKDSL